MTDKPRIKQLLGQGLLSAAEAAELLSGLIEEPVTIGELLFQAAFHDIELMTFGDFKTPEHPNRFVHRVDAIDCFYPPKAFPPERYPGFLEKCFPKGPDRKYDPMTNVYELPDDLHRLAEAESKESLIMGVGQKTPFKIPPEIQRGPLYFDREDIYELADILKSTGQDNPKDVRGLRRALKERDQEIKRLKSKLKEFTDLDPNTKSKWVVFPYATPGLLALLDIANYWVGHQKKLDAGINEVAESQDDVKNKLIAKGLSDRAAVSLAAIIQPDHQINRHSKRNQRKKKPSLKPKSPK